MNANLLVLAQAVLPTQAATVVRYGIYAALLISLAWAIIKVIKGIQSLERGEEGKQSIIAGILTPCAVFLVIGAFQAVGLWTALGVTLP